MQGWVGGVADLLAVSILIPLRQRLHTHAAAAAGAGAAAALLRRRAAAMASTTGGEGQADERLRQDGSNRVSVLLSQALRGADLGGCCYEKSDVG